MAGTKDNNGDLNMDTASDTVPVVLLNPFIDIEEEKYFCTYLSRMFNGEVSPEECILQWKDFCQQQAAGIKQQASEHAPEGSTSDTLAQFADFWELEGATWSLVWHLYRNTSTPIHLIPKHFGKLSTSQQLARWVTDNEDLKRCSRVVSWLEDLQYSAITPTHGGIRESKYISGITKGCAVWRESSNWWNCGGSDQLISKLDPDAPSRQQKLLSPGDAKSQERLNKAIWMLIRAGRMDRAQEICVSAGQPWRAATLAGNGPLGPLPMGHRVTSDNRDDFDMQMVEDFHEEQIAAEVDSMPEMNGCSETFTIGLVHRLHLKQKAHHHLQV